jgi:predicted Fe-Mo cluster-binding NifX family protein
LTTIPCLFIVNICTYYKLITKGEFSMKLCITAAGNDLTANTDSAFGRAPWFVLVDTESGAMEAIENASINASQGAGIAAAQTMANKNIEGVLTGRLGPKAQNALAAAGVKMFEGLASSTVAQALEQFKQGQYKESGASDAGAGAGTSTSTAPNNKLGSGGCGCGRGGGGGRGQGGGGGRGQGRGQGGRNQQ